MSERLELTGEQDPMRCDFCGGPFHGEIMESFTLEGRFCCDDCVALAEQQAAERGEPS